MDNQSNNAGAQGFVQIQTQINNYPPPLPTRQPPGKPPRYGLFIVMPIVVLACILSVVIFTVPSMTMPALDAVTPPTQTEDINTYSDDTNETSSDIAKNTNTSPDDVDETSSNPSNDEKVREKTVSNVPSSFKKNDSKKVEKIPSSPKIKKSILVMDSYANKRSRDQIRDTVATIVDINYIETPSIDKNPLTSDFIAAKQPDLIILHVSAYFNETDITNFNNYVMDFINQVGTKSEKTKFLVYSGAFKNQELGYSWLNKLIEKYTSYSGQCDGCRPSWEKRVSVINYPHETTISETLKRNMQNKVKEMLKIKA
jgi:hypothetical protein